MRLVVDAQALQTSGARRGIGRYVRSLLRALIRTHPGWVFEAVVNTALPAADDRDLLHRMQVSRFMPPLPMLADTRAANELYFGDWLAGRGGDAILELSFFDEESLAPQFVVPRPPLACIAFDLVPVLFHEQYLRSAHAHAIYRRRFRQFAQADLFLAISDTTRQDLLRLMDVGAERTVTIGGAAEEWTAQAVSSTPVERARRLSALHVDGPFLLYVGGPDPRKNLRGTLEAFAMLPERLRASCRLVIVCELTRSQESGLLMHARALGIESSVRLTNYVSDETLRMLYQECRASIFPSFYEGLGLPVLEALACGAPVVASNRSSIPALVGEAAVLVDPASPRAICEGIERVLAEPRERGDAERRRAAGAHTWDAVAGLAAAALVRLAGGVRPGTGGQVRPRIAWVSAAPPSDSKAARLSARLLPVLAGPLDLEVVVPPGVMVSSTFAPSLRILSPDVVWARALERPFDLFVYHVEAPVEPSLLELLHWQSGLVVLHESGEPSRWTVLGGSEALAAHDLRSWRTLRDTAGCPVFHLGAWESGGRDAMPVPDIARAYLAAIGLTLARRTARDGAWLDAAAAAAAESCHGGIDPAGMFEEWAQRRVEARQAAARDG